MLRRRQSVEEVLQREKIQFPPFIRQMNRVGQNGGAAALDNDADWVRRCRQRAIEGGTLQFGSNAAGQKGSAGLAGVKTGAVKAVHNYAKLRTERVVVKGLETKVKFKWVGLSKLCIFWVHVCQLRWKSYAEPAWLSTLTRCHRS